MREWTFAAIVSIMMTALAACATGNRPVPSPVPGAATGVYKAGDIIDLATARKVSFDHFIDRIQDARVIYLGEAHISVADHRFQQRVIEALCDRLGKVTVAMEMFSRNSQEVLDRWSRGELSEKDFIELSRWTQQWGYPFDFYRGTLDLVRDRELPLIGLNLPPEVVSKIAREGLASLTPAERALVAKDLDRSDTRHRQKMEQEYAAHPWAGIKNFDSFYDAQLAWEETMAERLAKEIETSPSRRPIVVIVGKGHVEGRFGIPERTERRVKHRYVVVTTVPIDEASSTRLSPELADYALITERLSFPPPRRSLLGVMLEPLPKGHGFRVVRIRPKSAAAAAGVLVGDELLRVDGVKPTHISDVQRALEHYSGYHTLLVRRENQVLTLVVLIRHEEVAKTGK